MGTSSFPRSQVDLEFPADMGLVQLARVVASSIAANLDFDVEEIDDLRIGVDECCVATLACADPLGSLRLRFEWDGASVRISATAPASEGAPSIDDMTAQILGTVVDDYRIERRGPEVFFELSKGRPGPEP